MRELNDYMYGPGGILNYILSLSDGLTLLNFELQQVHVNRIHNEMPT